MKVEELDKIVWSHLAELDGLRAVVESHVGRPEGGSPTSNKPVRWDYVSRNGRWWPEGRPPEPFRDSYKAEALRPDYDDRQTRRVLFLEPPPKVRAVSRAYFEKKRGRR